MSKPNNKNQSKSQVKPQEKIPENINEAKTIKLFFSEDKFYNGALIYKKGTHEVETKNGWAGRWISRGAKLIVGDSQVGATVDLKGDIKIDVPPQTKIEENIPAKEEEFTIQETPVETFDTAEDKEINL